MTCPVVLERPSHRCVDRDGFPLLPGSGKACWTLARRETLLLAVERARALQPGQLTLKAAGE